MNTKLSSQWFLTKRFQQFLETKLEPSDLKTGKVIRVCMSGSKFFSLNYRPILLACICRNLLEHIIYKHLINFLESCEFSTNAQHCFRKKSLVNFSFLLTTCLKLMTLAFLLKPFSLTSLKHSTRSLIVVHCLNSLY